MTEDTGRETIAEEDVGEVLAGEYGWTPREIRIGQVALRMVDPPEMPEGYDLEELLHSLLLATAVVVRAEEAARYDDA